jgi:Type I site-specific restriction-modification system, R (restriction) subunit and related helicases
MLFTAKNLLDRDILDAPQLFVVVDTDKLNSQMRDQLANLSFERWTEAKSIEGLEDTITAGRSELVVTTVQKFQDVDPGVQSSDEVVVMSDEAHRFMEADLGSRLEAALPDAFHFGFTGHLFEKATVTKTATRSTSSRPATKSIFTGTRLKPGLTTN